MKYTWKRSVKAVLLGAPGAGKGTIAKLLAKKYEIPTVSTGDLLRKEAASGSELGNSIKARIDVGEFVPDEVSTELIANWLESQNISNGFLLDGYPRNMVQVNALWNLLDDINLDINHAILLTVEPETLVERLLERGRLTGRADDTKDIILKRFNIYNEVTAPIIKFFESKDLLRTVSNQGNIESTLEQIIQIIDTNPLGSSIFKPAKNI